MYNIISTVGLTDEPILKALQENPVKKAFFIVSKESKLEKITALLDKKEVPYETEIVDDAEDIKACYLATKKVLLKAGAKSEPQNILLNYTGGTKTMAAASVLAASDFGVKSIYVGGSKRDSAGRVLTGFEMPRTSRDPKKTLLIEEKKMAVYFFNKGQYETAGKIANDAKQLADGWDSEALEILIKLSYTYNNWDLFKHRHLDILKSVLAKAEEYHKKFGVEIVPLKQLNGNIDFYSTLYNRGNSVPVELVVDLFYNAKRRIDSGRYDDAVARLYRCLEMFAQSLLLEKYGLNTSTLNQEKLPESAKKVLEGKTQIALADDYALLLCMGDAAGKLYQKHKDELRDILISRNLSILAHGCNPIKREVVGKFCDTIDKFFFAASLKLADYSGATFCKFSEIPDEISYK